MTPTCGALMANHSPISPRPRNPLHSVPTCRSRRSANDHRDRSGAAGRCPRRAAFRRRRGSDGSGMPGGLSLRRGSQSVGALSWRQPSLRDTGRAGRETELARPGTQSGCSHHPVSRKHRAGRRKRTTVQINRRFASGVPPALLPRGHPPARPSRARAAFARLLPPRWHGVRKATRTRFRSLGSETSGRR